MATLRIMSFNMRYPCPADGANAFPRRKGRILATLNSTAPDIIGFQEITPEIRDFLVESLPGYYTVGGGRDADYGGEASLIAFKKDANVVFPSPLCAKTCVNSPSKEISFCFKQP